MWLAYILFRLCVDWSTTIMYMYKMCLHKFPLAFFQASLTARIPLAPQSRPSSRNQPQPVTTPPRSTTLGRDSPVHRLTPSQASASHTAPSTHYRKSPHREQQTLTGHTKEMAGPVHSHLSVYPTPTPSQQLINTTPLSVLFHVTSLTLHPCP